MVLRISLITFLIFFWGHLSAQDRFVVYFKDKEGSQFSLSQPEAFLSERSLERRLRQNIALDEKDLPVSDIYLNALSVAGIKCYYPSKWLNAVLIQENAEAVDYLLGLEFVDRVEKVASNPRLSPGGRIGSVENASDIQSSHNVAYQWHGIDRIHENNNFGEGKMIAVMDANFFGADVIPQLSHLFDNERILMIENFVEGNKEIFKGPYSHGTQVLSVMAGKLDGSFQGIATESMYLLFQTEDAPTEYRVEEYNWTVAAEKADSAGADVINTSLGYSYGFSDPSMNYSYSDMDGNTTMISMAAKKAVATGMMVVVSAGNEGGSPWQYITAPADVEGVLAVGAITSDSIRASFSSFGPTYDGRQKPDVVSLGVAVPLINSQGQLVSSSGTSFSAPIMAGFAALLWNEYPELTNIELHELITSSGHLAASPNNAMGSGIPNIQIVLGSDPPQILSETKLFPVPAKNQLNWISDKKFSQYNIISMHGAIIRSDLTGTGNSIDVGSLQSGFYILELKGHGMTERYRFVKK